MDNEYKLGQGNEENNLNQGEQETTNSEVNFVLQESPEEKEQKVVQSVEQVQETPIEDAQPEKEVDEGNGQKANI